LFDNQIRTLKSFMSWNGFPLKIRNFWYTSSKTRLHLTLIHLNKMPTVIYPTFIWEYHILVNKVKI
jgi:hypothetical protein